MNDNDRSDERLTQLLKAWRVEEPLPRHFQAGVWTRIAQTERLSAADIWKHLVIRLDALLGRPALATAYVGAVLVLGLVAGYWQAQRDLGHRRSELQERYVRTVDPYQRTEL